MLSTLSEFGVALKLPQDLRVIRDEERVAELQGPDGVVYHVFSFPGLHMVFRPGLEEAMQRHARLLFDEAFVNNGGEGRKRTDDLDWTPLVEMTPITVGGAPALRTVHRMLYQPGKEMVMGHLLVPLAGGLFEVRVIALDRTTGFRESVIVVQKQVSGFLPQKDYDDPAHDAQFPQHSLSRVRAALRALADGCQVQKPAPQFPDTQILLPRIGCAVRPPSGFVQAPDFDGDRERFERTSFCGTDGCETFLVEPKATRVKASQLRKTAEADCRDLHLRSGVTELSLQVDERGDDVLVIAQGNRGRLRNALRYFLDGRGNLQSLAIVSTCAIPVSILDAELDASRRSFRTIG